jgi:hypothetical protein
MGLRLVGTAEQVSIEWDGSSDNIRRAVSASLEISDGGALHSLPLDATTLYTGRVAYVRQSGKVGVTLRVKGDNGAFEERAHFIGPPVAHPQVIEVAEPKPEPPPAQTEPLPRKDTKSELPRDRQPRIRFGANIRPAETLLPADGPPRLEFFAAKPQPSALSSSVGWAPPPTAPDRPPRLPAERYGRGY